MEKRVFIKMDDYYIPGIFCVAEKREKKSPAVILCHGFLSYKEGDGFMFNKMASVLLDHGIASLRIDFCSMGENRNNRREYGILQMIREVECAYNWLLKQEEIDEDKVGLIGHSLGGRVAALSSSLNPCCIVSLNGALQNKMSSMKNVNQDDLNKQGYTIVHTSDNRSELLYQKFFNDLKQAEEINAINNYRKPFLIVVGEKDPTVLPKVGLDFYDSYENDKKDLLVISDANHTFNAKTGDYTKTLEMSEKVSDWLENIFF